MAFQFHLGRFGRLKHRLIVVGQAINQISVKQMAEFHFSVEYFSNFKDFKAIDVPDDYSLWIHFDTTLDIQDFDGIELPKFLLTTTTGLTHLGIDLRKKLGDKILSLSSEPELLKRVTSTAEHTWSLVMAISSPWLQNLRNYKQYTRSELVRQNQMSSRKFGVIGYGRLGRMVAEYALAFGMEVFVYDIDESIVLPKVATMRRLSTIEELLQKCDIVSIHASAILHQQIILSYEILRSCRKGISIINTSRGSLVDEQAIVRLLDEKTLDWYATDVLNEEEIGADASPKELKERSKTLNRVIVTPHIGGANLEAMELCESNLLSRFIANHATDFLE